MKVQRNATADYQQTRLGLVALYPDGTAKIWQKDSDGKNVERPILADFAHELVADARRKAKVT